ncbi:MAG: hydroxyacid dehydrogenase [Gammaproteobacteria bacterium]
MTTSHFTIAYFDRWQHAAGLERLAQAPELRVLRFDSHAPAERIWPDFRAAHGYQIRSTRDELPVFLHARAELLARCPHLLAISADGVGYDTVDVDACTAAGVLVINQAGGNREAVAEHTLGMMLCLSKRIIESDRALRRDRAWHRNDFIGNDILGKTIGIVGLGHIGTRVAELCKGLLRMRVLAYDPYLRPADFAARGAESAPLAELLRSADFVSLHCPRNAETLGMIGAAELAVMKPSAYFITTARGGIHDERALIDALRARRIRGAGLDVWAVEPPALDNPLLQLDNVVMSPHIAGVTEERGATSRCKRWSSGG